MIIRFLKWLLGLRSPSREVFNVDNWERKEKYILKNGIPVLEPDYQKWSTWYDNVEENRCIKFTKVGNVNISTVFVGCNFSNAPVVFFETKIFYGKHDQYTETYNTLDDALVGHERSVSLVKSDEVIAT